MNYSCTYTLRVPNTSLRSLVVVLVLIVSFGLIGPATATQRQEASQHQAINEVIQRYIEGGKQGKSAIMKPAFHEQATMYFVASGNIHGGSIQGLFDAIDKAGPSPSLIGKIAAIDVNETTATVRIELYNWGGARYTDQMSLLKTNGAWKIISKVYHQTK